MEATIKGKQDFLSGLLFIAIALAFIVNGRGLPLGTAVNMGPGYIPLGAALILAVLGTVCLVRGLVHAGAGVEPVSWRPFLLVPLAVVAFGISLDWLGLVAAIFLAVFVGRAAIPRAPLLPTLALAVGLSALSVALFYYGFKLPVSVWPRFL
ncbi:MAG: tripartite tricarboxylate transporter TctB family protein [Rhizobiaceae bacterium]|nr:tripartite tricarboxylate transporter TctB family protein [Rhizobiaceae bacterium]